MRQYRNKMNKENGFNDILLRVPKTAVLYPAALLVATGLTMVTLGMIFYMRDVYQASAALIGWYQSFWSLTYITGCLFLTRYIERLLPRHAILAATLGMAAIILSLLLVRSIVLAFVFYGLFGLTLSFFWPPLIGWLSHGMEGPRLNKAMGGFNLSWSLGTIISPYLTGALSESASTIPIYTAVILFISTALIILGATYLFPNLRNEKHFISKNPTAEKSYQRDLSTFLRFPSWFGLFTTFVVVGVMINIFPVFCREVLNLNKRLIGFLLLTRTLFATFGYILLGRTTFWHFKSNHIITAQILLTLIIGLLILADSVSALYILFPFLGLLTAFSYSSSLFHGITGSLNRTRRTAIHEAIIGAGLILGASIGGILYQNYSMRMVYVFCILVSLCTVIIQVVLGYHGKKRNQSREEYRKALKV